MIKKVSQLELENFASGTAQAEEAEGGELLSVQDVRAQELMFQQLLIKSGKMAEGEEVPSWADVYQRMLNANIRPRIAAYIAWATMPKKYRYPETQQELATKVLGLTSDRAISTWRKKFPEIDVMISELQAEAMLEFRPGAFHALGSVASDPSYRAASDRRLFFEMTRDYTPRAKVETSEGTGVGRKLLNKLKSQSTAQLLEALGEDAIELIKEFEDDLNAADDDTPLPSASPQIEEHDLEGDDE